MESEGEDGGAVNQRGLKLNEIRFVGAAVRVELRYLLEVGAINNILVILLTIKVN